MVDVSVVDNRVVESVGIVVIVGGRVTLVDVSVVDNPVVEGVILFVVVVVSGFAGGRITNFNSRERVTAIMTKMIKEMEMIHRRCRRLG